MRPCPDELAPGQALEQAPGLMKGEFSKVDARETAVVAIEMEAAVGVVEKYLVFPVVRAVAIEAGAEGFIRLRQP